jgi:hypothetical protein
MLHSVAGYLTHFKAIKTFISKLCETYLQFRTTIVSGDGAWYSYLDVSTYTRRAGLRHIPYTSQTPKPRSGVLCLMCGSCLPVFLSVP